MSQHFRYLYVLTRMPIERVRCPVESDFSGEDFGVVLAQSVIPVQPVVCTVVQVEAMAILLRSRVSAQMLLVSSGDKDSSQ